jgi:hypothetical protein
MRLQYYQPVDTRGKRPIRRLLPWLIIAGCGGSPSEVAAPAADDAEPARVFRAFLAAFDTRRLEPVMAYLADDVVLIGVGGCKGRPCRGKAQAREKFLASTVPGGWKYEMKVERVAGDRLDATWRSSIPPDAATASPSGVGSARGQVTVRVRGGKITSLRLRYDLSDPESILLRQALGEIVFSLKRADGFAITPDRVIVQPHSEDSAVVVYVDDLPSNSLVAHIHRGACGAGGEIAFELSTFAEGESHSVVPLAESAFAAGAPALNVDLHRRGAAAPILCGNIPATSRQR